MCGGGLKVATAHPVPAYMHSLCEVCAQGALVRDAVRWERPDVRAAVLVADRWCTEAPVSP